MKSPKMSCHDFCRYPWHVIKVIKVIKEFSVSCHSPQKTEKKAGFSTTLRPREPAKTCWFSRLSKMLRVRAMSGEVLWGPQEPGGLPWVAMGCWGCGVKTWVIWGASWIGHIMFYKTYRNLRCAPKTTALPFIWMLNEGEHSTRVKNML